MSSGKPFVKIKIPSHNDTFTSTTEKNKNNLASATFLLALQVLEIGMLPSKQIGIPTPTGELTYKRNKSTPTFSFHENTANTVV